eukprot:841577-Alexandrium_andersonii.AAC.1
MSASLVGSEMCIRDRCRDTLLALPTDRFLGSSYDPEKGEGRAPASGCRTCLLYTSDAADDM